MQPQVAPTLPPYALRKAASLWYPPRQGSLLHKDRVAAHSDQLVEVLEANGAIVLGKTNTPEFGAGGNTFNECALKSAGLIP